MKEGIGLEVQSLPELMCWKFVFVCYHNYEHLYSFWHEGIIHVVLFCF